MENTYFYQDHLKRELSDRLNRNRRYSLRTFAKFLDIDAGDLSRILNGSKVLTPDLAKKILQKIPLSSTENQEFLFSMARAYEEKGIKRKKTEVKKILKKSKDRKISKDLSLDIFRVISDWYHYAILQLIDSEGFVNDANWISRQLDLNEFEVKVALERMIALDLIQRKGESLIRTHQVLTTGDRSITSSALRKRIKQVSDKSIFSLENDSIDIRNHTTMTMSIDPDKIPAAKEIIQDFMDKMEEVLETKKKKVYELQINLFPLQRT